jgi:hypothetical protein
MVSGAWPRLAAIGAAFVLLLLAPVSIPVDDDYRTPAAHWGDGVVAIKPGGVLRQELPVTGKAIREVLLELGESSTPLQGRLIVEIWRAREEGWTKIATRTIVLEKTVRLLRHLRFKKPLKLKGSKRLAIVVRAAPELRRPVKVSINPQEQTPDFALSLDGAPVRSTAQIGILYQRFEGRVATALPRIWRRVTVLLGPFGKSLFFVGFGLLLLGIFALALTPSRTSPQQSTVKD